MRISANKAAAGLVLTSMFLFASSGALRRAELLHEERMVRKTAISSTIYSSLRSPPGRKDLRVVLPACAGAARMDGDFNAALSGMEIPCSIPPYSTWKDFFVSNTNAVSIVPGLGFNGVAFSSARSISLDPACAARRLRYMSILAHEGGHLHSAPPSRVLPIHSDEDVPSFPKKTDSSLEGERQAVHYQLKFHADYFQFHSRSLSEDGAKALSDSLDSLEKAYLEYSLSYSGFSMFSAARMARGILLLLGAAIGAFSWLREQFRYYCGREKPCDFNQD